MDMARSLMLCILTMPQCFCRLYPYADLAVRFPGPNKQICVDSIVDITVFAPYPNYWANYDCILFMMGTDIVYEYYPFSNKSISKYSEASLLRFVDQKDIIFQLNFTSTNFNSSWIVLYRKSKLMVNLMSFTVTSKPKPLMLISWKHFQSTDKLVKKEDDRIVITCEIINVSSIFHSLSVKFTFPSDTIFQKTEVKQFIVHGFIILRAGIVNKTLTCTFGSWQVMDSSILSFRIKKVTKKKPLDKNQMIITSLVGFGVIFLLVLLVLVYYYKQKYEKESKIRHYNPSFLKKTLFQNNSNIGANFQSGLIQTSKNSEDILARRHLFLKQR